MTPDISHIRFGTSSWAYEGWQGLVYQQTYPEAPSVLVNNCGKNAHQLTASFVVHPRT